MRIVPPRVVSKLFSVYEPNFTIEYLSLKFRELVKPRLPHDYMSQDIYLLTWLRGNTYINM